MRYLIKFFCLFLFCQYVWSQQPKGSEKETDSTRFKYTYPNSFYEEPSWRLSLPVWIPGFRGSFAYGDVEIDPGYGNDAPDQPDDDDKLRQSELSIQFYLLANFSYRYKRFFIEADGMKATLDDNISFIDRDRLQFGGTIDGTILRGFLGYRFYEKTYSDRLLKWSLEGYAGIRFFDVHVFAKRIELLDVQMDWIDPIVGIRAPLAWKRWIFFLQGDYGGNIGGDHRSFFAAFNASYSFSKLFGTGVGWAYLNARYKGQFDGQDLQVGMELTGPVARINFTF